MLKLSLNADIESSTPQATTSISTAGVATGSICLMAETAGVIHIKVGRGCTRKFMVENTRLINSFDPFANLTESERKLVVGGEFCLLTDNTDLSGQASLWTEQTDSMNMETVMWPRAAALAEVFWTGSSHGSFPLSKSVKSRTLTCRCDRASASLQ